MPTWPFSSYGPGFHLQLLRNESAFQVYPGSGRVNFSLCLCVRDTHTHAYNTLSLAVKRNGLVNLQAKAKSGMLKREREWIPLYMWAVIGAVFTLVANNKDLTQINGAIDSCLSISTSRTFIVKWWVTAEEGTIDFRYQVPGIWIYFSPLSVYIF